MIACVDIDDTSIEDDNIAELEARMARLLGLKRTLLDLIKNPRSPGELPVRIPETYRILQERAPHGYLQETLLSLFKEEGIKLTNAEIRGALYRMAYPYAIDNMNLRKTLARLCDRHVLHSAHRGGTVFFSRPKQKED